MNKLILAIALLVAPLAVGTASAHRYCPPPASGSCNQYGCAPAGGSCNQYGCTDNGACNQYGCP